MLERAMFDTFRIYPEQVMSVGDDQLILSDGVQYLLREIDSAMLNIIREKEAMAEWLEFYGEQDVAKLLRQDGKGRTLHVDGQEWIAFEIPSSKTIISDNNLGKRLAKFHQRGASYAPHQKSSQNLSWKAKWTKRLDQLENWFVYISNKSGKTYFDEQFCLTFPYFLGLSENAIQYITDMELDNQVQTPPFYTICHVRFKSNTWLTLDETSTSRIKVPTDFTYDHFTRDIAEYIRNIWSEKGWSEACKKEVLLFLKEYEMIHRLTSYEQKKLIARLMFPIHYFEMVEEYYQSNDEKQMRRREKECLHIFESASDYEELLKFIVDKFAQLHSNIELPHWIPSKTTRKEVVKMSQHKIAARLQK
ncbi:spore coat putative kinase YutH [Evansella cellulosilytica]|uniref:Spore coat protein YutH n=1 Tax=Evansella cellulosilytica (strain ATCC 21833 / DSM 2522 / FERM P-1141 / JCM 9156 / N-4) TaxID=649639 RepID=E6U2E1_EVAC2|nr:spore coat protein YutH [Evansella cellulosilytica]ADU31654.1 spore coat protein YutH [Evansella cellulosilytica DSM 2522]